MPRPRNDRTPKQQLSYDRKLAAGAEGRAALRDMAERATFVAQNTARLRGLRLAREAREADGGPATE